jgi:hypothetical protein
MMFGGASEPNLIISLSNQEFKEGNGGDKAESKSPG